MKKQLTPEQQERRENMKEAIGGGAVYLGIYVLAVVLFAVCFSKCGGTVPIDDDYGLYMMTKNNIKSTVNRPESKISQDELTRWYAAYNRIRAANSGTSPQKTR